ncbi:hypothetical protein MGYG_03500 [Nannizzia gypsea CBS 118893]|uniref:Uncharacterized protein n=1 Tax=Arthroderma gypseum (strain ATCC MYA-4604 / CBS 118893) TaxID=535722 RepID=E4USD1_ARTGP|nr:hypothetical protein MGYG_03500 [Nannizzia gypsea CBS 118893]EFR00498.1 hypothetical protein MGYG_03500 [Nannizzia gypsea CBS 118893]
MTASKAPPLPLLPLPPFPPSSAITLVKATIRGTPSLIMYRGHAPPLSCYTCSLRGSRAAIPP